MASLALTFGSGAMTNSIADTKKTDLFFMVGSNPDTSHPTIGMRIHQAIDRGAKLIVVDPRRTRLAERADLWLRILPGTDVAFLNGMMHVILEENLWDRKFVEERTEDFAELQNLVKKYTPDQVERITGIPEDQLRQAARMYAAEGRNAIFWGMGITHYVTGTDRVKSLANLSMLCGKVGMEGGGCNPLRGQNNVQGACDMGALPNVFPGYQRVDNADARTKFEKAWGVKKLPDKPGLMIPQMIEGLTNGTVKLFYIFGENLANTEPDIRHVEHCLESAEFVVCHDIFQTETTRFAHVIFPAAAWSENDGTFTSSERRISRVRTASLPPGEAKPNWWIFKEIAKRMGHEWSAKSAREIWDNEISQLAPSMAGVKYARLRGDGLQWPAPNEEHPGTATLHRDRFTSGLGALTPVDWIPPAEVPDEDYPLVLSTGRRLYHYHTRTQTGRSAGLNDLLGEETADISPSDAKALSIGHGEMIGVKSRRGQVFVKANITDRIPQGVVWMAFHFREACANWLTNPAFDPITLTAEYKACAVRIEKVGEKTDQRI